jgi:hypothetical protein
MRDIRSPLTGDPQSTLGKGHEQAAEDRSLKSEVKRQKAETGEGSFLLFCLLPFAF